MNDPVDAAPGSITSSQRPKRARVALSELSLIVRPPGQLEAIQAFTASEAAKAQKYADAMDAQVDPSLAPERLSTGVGLTRGCGRAQARR